MEVIKEIKEVEGIKGHDKYDWMRFDGYQVTTDSQSIVLGISNGQDCCEQWGYFMSNDDIQSFVGAELKEIRVVDEALNSHDLEKHLGYSMYDGGVMYVNLETDRGTLQFTAYNSHNGYYGHTAVVRSSTLKHEASL
jgi:hypothetical protein